MLILQNKNTGEIKKIKTGFDWSTLLFAFLGMSFLPSIFRKDFFSAIFLLIVEILPFLGLYLYLKDKSQVTSLLLLLTIYIEIVCIIVKCFTNKRKVVKKLKANGFEPILLNNIINPK